MELTNEDRLALQRAVKFLEFPTLTDKITAMLGWPMDKLLSAIPKKLQDKLTKAIEVTVNKSLDFVLYSVDETKMHKRSSDWTHKVLASGAGFAGGFVGGWGVVMELPITTGLMLRTIADIARSEGEDLSTIEARMACVEVLTLDTSHPVSADKRDVYPAVRHADVSVYYALRNSLAATVADAAQYLAATASRRATGEAFAAGTTLTARDKIAGRAAKESAPVVVELIRRVAERYGLTVSEEVAAQLVPVIGGIGGASMNYLFTDHFQRIAHGHFTVRRLERKYGSVLVQNAYAQVLHEMNHTEKEVAASLSLRLED